MTIINILWYNCSNKFVTQILMNGEQHLFKDHTNSLIKSLLDQIYTTIWYIRNAGKLLIVKFVFYSLPTVERVEQSTRNQTAGFECRNYLCL